MEMGRVKRGYVEGIQDEFEEVNAFGKKEHEAMLAEKIKKELYEYANVLNEEAQWKNKVNEQL